MNKDFDIEIKEYNISLKEAKKHTDYKIKIKLVSNYDFNLDSLVYEGIEVTDFESVKNIKDDDNYNHIKEYVAKIRFDKHIDELDVEDSIEDDTFEDTYPLDKLLGLNLKDIVVTIKRTGEIIKLSDLKEE